MKQRVLSNLTLGRINEVVVLNKESWGEKRARGKDQAGVMPMAQVGQ